MTRPVRFALLAAMTLGGVAAGGGLSLALGTAVPLEEWACFGAGALLAAAIGTTVLGRLAATATEPAPPVTVTPESHRRLRHDLRGALSPALLTADRLLTHEDPSVRRAGDVMVRSVERAAALLADPEATPPARR